MDNKELVDDFFQTEYAQQVIQKGKLIQGDIAMKRNFKENIKFLQMVIKTMDEKIKSSLLTGGKTTGYEQLRNECEKWIGLIYRSKDDANG